jgi:Reverse transcriptase (RNA-dependent DNA polymerase).
VVFLDVAKAFDTVRFDGLLYKLKSFIFSRTLLKLSSYMNIRTFETSFQTDTYTLRRIRAGVAQGRIISVCM